MSTIPEQLHDYLDWLTEAVYEMGYRDALHDIATRQAELDAAWRPVGRASYEQRVAARIAEAERHARQLRVELDRRTDATMEWPPVAAPDQAECLGSPRGSDPSTGA
jgi:hypothetical protein